MAATVRISDMEVTVDRGVWTSSSDVLVAILASVTRRVEITPDVPDADYALAQLVVTLLGGELVDHVPPEHVTGRVY